jgi:predicted nucleic acid-binding protein
MSVEKFLDTNVLVYQLDTTDPRKSATADAIVREAILTGNACISYQVVQEFLNTALRKASVPLDVTSARAYLGSVLAPLMRVSASVDLYHRALGVHDRFRYSFYDSLVIAAALEAGCRRLLSEDLHDGQQIEFLTIENPFG